MVNKNISSYTKVQSKSLGLIDSQNFLGQILKNFATKGLVVSFSNKKHFSKLMLFKINEDIKETTFLNKSYKKFKNFA